MAWAKKEEQCNKIVTQLGFKLAENNPICNLIRNYL